jgi:hypothetical protein
MNKMILALSAAALIAGTASAFATTTERGVVSYTDTSTGILKLADGESFKISQPVLLKGVAPGDHIVVTVFDNKDVGFHTDNRYYDDHESTN